MDKRKTNGSEESAQGMPVPSSAQEASAGTAAAPEGGMPTPKMGEGASGDEMPRPQYSTTPEQQGPSAAGMTVPSLSSVTNRRGQPAGGLPRFPDQQKGALSLHEPGVIEVQFREGVMPTVPSGTRSGTAEIHAASGPLTDINQLLNGYGLIGAEPTFLTSHEEATSAQRTAQAKGIDAPHLGHFVTLHFREDANLVQIVEQLNQRPEVEKAVMVPTALPPSYATAAESVPFRAEERLGELAPAPNPLAEPLVGSGDQVVLNQGTGLENQWYIFRCGVNKAWSRASGSNVVIADVDWGCRVSHQDLTGRINRTYNAYDGSADVTHGGSVFHGTGVMALAGATVNGKGISGIAYDSLLWPVQADSGTGTSLGGNPWARGIDWVRTADSGGRRKIVILEVQTGSFGNYEQVPSVNAAIKTAIASGVVVCVAAGNGDRDAGIDDSGAPIPETGSILVGATAYDGSQNKRAWFSNYGPRIVVSAPGDSGHDLTCDSASDIAYRNGFGGTSGATPKVAGVAALMLSANPGLSHESLREVLRSTGTSLAPDAGKPTGTFLNADAAVRQVTAAAGRLEIFVRGSDRALWHMWQIAPNDGWSGWASLGGDIDIVTSARNADGRLEVFARGTDHAVWHIWQTSPSNGWSAWGSLGGWVDRISVGQNADGRLEIFARGSDNALWHKWQTVPNGGWSGWESLGGWIDMMAVGQNADGRLEAFARGSDGAVWHRWQTVPNGGWSGWESLGGWIDQLTVGKNADGRLEIVARGADRAVWHKWQTAPNGGWSGWESLGGWVDLLETGSNADGRLEVFARGSDHAVWHIWQTAPNSGWSGWESMGGWVDQIAVKNNADGRLELLARGSDKALWHKWQTAPNNGWSGWASLGGWIDLLDVDRNAS